MKCTKCGNELKEGIKFCPQCGEEIKEEKKIRYCTKCGAEMQPDSSFCAKCGNSVNVAQEQGTTKKPKKQGGKAKKIFLIAGIVIVVLLSIGGIMLNSEKAMYKAYAKFHEEYCEKNLDTEESVDCSARIIMSPENEKWLAIYDITYVEYDKDEEDEEEHVESVKDKLVLYRYSWGKVKKVATFLKKTLADYEFVNFSVIDDELYLFADCYGDVSKKGNLKGAYRLNGDKFETVKVNEEKMKYKDYVYENVKRKYTDLLKDTGLKDDMVETALEEMIDNIDSDTEYYIYTIDSGLNVSDVIFLGNCRYFSHYNHQGEEYEKYKGQLHAINDVRGTSVTEFTEVIEELSKFKIKNQTDLQIAYGKIFKEFGLHPFLEEYYENPLSVDYPVVGTIKTEYGCYYVRTSGNVALTYLSEKYDFYKAIESADGRKVTGIELENCDIYIKHLKLTDNVTYIGQDAFSSILTEDIEVPDSVEKIGEDAFGDSYGLLPVIIAQKGSYAQKYAEKNNLDWSEKKLSEDELEERKNIVKALREYQAYINNYEAEYDGEEYRGVTLGYVNDDNIPECFVWKTYPSIHISYTFHLLH